MPGIRVRSLVIRLSTFVAALVLLPLAPAALFAQAAPAAAKPEAKPAAPKPAPDTLVFVNGEQLSGTLEKADGAGITFNSPMAGELTIKWANIKELRSDKNFAVLSKQQKLTRRDALAVVPQGTVRVEDKQLVVATTAGPKTVELKDADRLIDAAAFEKALNHPPNELQNWSGTVTAGASLVRATENTTTYNGAVALGRTTPAVDWLPPRTRTAVDFNQTYGTTSQRGTQTIESNILHADAERDQYFSPRLFSFGSATFDHNFSQSLALQQAYGGGVGITLTKNAHHELDLKADVHYEKQVFFNPTVGQNQNIIGSTFSERYLRNLRRGIVLTEFGSVSPAWNQSQDYSAHVNATMTLPIFKSLGVSLGVVEDYLNNAPVGTNQNSSQFTTGLTYTLKPR